MLSAVNEAIKHHICGMCRLSVMFPATTVVVFATRSLRVMATNRSRAIIRTIQPRKAE